MQAMGVMPSLEALEMAGASRHSVTVSTVVEVFNPEGGKGLRHCATALILYLNPKMVGLVSHTLTKFPQRLRLPFSWSSMPNTMLLRMPRCRP